MDKAEAIKILKDFHNESAIFSVRTALETLHPELKESEDEKIRKALVDTFKFYETSINSPYLLGISKKDVLAWLEKQGRHIPMQNGVIIDGVEYELIKDGEEDECERCALHELCNSMEDCLCNALYSPYVSVRRRFEKR